MFTWLEVPKLNMSPLLTLTVLIISSPCHFHCSLKIRLQASSELTGFLSVTLLKVGSDHGIQVNLTPIEYVCPFWLCAILTENVTDSQTIDLFFLKLKIESSFCYTCIILHVPINTYVLSVIFTEIIIKR